MNLKQLKIEAEKELTKASSEQGLKAIDKKYLGKKGEIAEVFASLKKLPQGKRKKMGEQANQIKKEIESLIEKKKKQLTTNNQSRGVLQGIDSTRPGPQQETGHLHLISQVRKRAAEIFQSMGFEVIEGPEVETEWYNFDALNFPKNHPARDIQDTFWLKNKPGLLPRTHTSPVQIRYMEKNKPPLRIVVPGRVFRNEATDANHEAQFYQLEGLMVDKNVSASNFKAIIQEFLTRYFETKVEIRLRPGFFPFTEPSFEIDARRQGGQWLELMGAGMVHPNVLKAAKVDPKQWSGFAFGVGIERLAMVKHKIPDLRLFYQSDLRFLKQF